MKLPTDYNRAQAADGSGGGQQIPAGGYVCIIKLAEERTLPNGSQMLRVNFDIFEGEYKGAFMKRFEQDAASGRTEWRGRYDVFVLTRDGATNPFFKGLITAVEKSNPNAQLIRDGELSPERMKNCVVGLLFREEEFLGQDGKPHRTTRPSVAVEASKIRSGDFTIPKPRLLEPERLGFTPAPEPADDELPFL